MTMEAENVTTYEEEKGFTSEVKIAGDVIATIAGLAATALKTDFVNIKKSVTIFT